MNDKAIVIAGGSGFIGNALAKAFAATDRPVFCPDPKTAAANRRHPGDSVGWRADG